MPDLSQNRRFVAHFVMGCCLTAFPGCTSIWNRSKNDAETAELQKLMAVPKPPETVGLATRPIGLEPMMVSGVSAINNLNGTGGAPDPSSDRDALLEEMKRYDVPEAEKFLEESDTALVKVQAIVPPGARRGDPIDVQVICPVDARATDLAGGWLLDTRLQEQMRVRGSAFHGPSIRKGDTMVIATGSVLTHAGYDSANRPQDKIEGIVIRGGRVQKDRTLSLGIARRYAHAKVAAAMADAINDRFFFFDGSSKDGIANAANESAVEIEVPPRYRGSVPRLMAVVGAIAINPARRESQAYLQEISERLKVPSTASSAALAAEALGESAVPTLIAELQNPNPEIQFYAAEALAYLDRPEAIEPLKTLLSDVPAFRHAGFLALHRMKHPDVNEMLESLISHPSLETRYAAITSLRRRGTGSRMIRTQNAGTFLVHTVNTPETETETDQSAVIGSLRDQPELIVAGNPELNIGTFLRSPSGVVVKRAGNGRLEIHRLVADGEDRHAEVDASVSDFVVGLAQVGCHYQQMIEMLRLAKDQGALSAQFVMDPLPKPTRKYHRDTEAT